MYQVEERVLPRTTCGIRMDDETWSENREWWIRRCISRVYMFAKSMASASRTGRPNGAGISMQRGFRWEKEVRRDNSEVYLICRPF